MGSVLRRGESRVLMLGPIDIVKLGLGKWIQLRGHHIDIIVGETRIVGTVDADLRIGEELAPDSKDKG